MGNEADAKASLLGKVAKFIKNPTGERDGSSHSQPASDSVPSHLALKDMIENKRRNDGVRKREFDLLRQIRRKDKRPSEFMDLSSSYASSQSPRDIGMSSGGQKRERTLRKIDEIEAQLSRSWFRKPGEPPTVPMDIQPAQLQRPATRTEPPPPAAAHDPGRSSIHASDFAPAIRPSEAGILGQPRPSSRPPFSTHGAGPIQQKLDFDLIAPPEPPVLTQTYQPGAPKPAPRHNAPNATAVPAKPGLEQLEWSSLTAKQVTHAPEESRPAALRRASVHESALEGQLEVVAPRQDPEIEQAAISFANGDEAAAELTLLKLVSANGSRREDVTVWLTLFDLYRVTGKSDAFNDLAPEFITLFGRSAPQWERTHGKTPSPKPNTAPQTATRAGAFTWTSPAQINTRALAALTGAVSRSAPPWRIDWRAVKTVEPDALPLLNELFAQWADTPRPLQFLAGQRLLDVLAGQSPTEDKNVNPVWWQTRLSLLRLMNAPDLFDQTALDYCITYEISPSAWTPPKGSYTSLGADGQPETEPADDPVSGPHTFAPTTMSGDLPIATDVFEATLEGEILNSADQALATLPAHLEHTRSLNFNCRALRRVDFGAAGELLNWSIKQQGQGRTVTFRDVHRLLAAFFSVIGIDAVAQVVLRKD